MSKPVSRDVAVRATAEPDHGFAERAVVHVHAAAPADPQRVDAERVQVEDARLEHRREEVVGGADRVDVAGEVEVEILHRHDLRVPAARGAALDPEHRAERCLAEAEHGLLADLPEALGERDRRRRLSLSGLRRRDRRHADELRVRLAGETLEDGEIDLGLVAPVELDLLRKQAESVRDLGDRLELRCLGDFEARRHQARVVGGRHGGIVLTCFSLDRPSVYASATPVPESADRKSASIACAWATASSRPSRRAAWPRIASDRFSSSSR